MLAHRPGVLQVDGWGGFKRLTGKQNAVPDDVDVTLAFCWSHGRRQFFEIHQSSQSPIAGEVLRRIAELYRIEDEIRGQPPDARQAVRQDRSRAKVDALKVYLDEQLARVSGKMPVAKAIRYMLSHWDGLCVFLIDGRVELDTNTIERLHRVVATTRKNAVRRRGLRRPVLGDLHLADPECQDERPQSLRVPEGRARADRLR